MRIQHRSENISSIILTTFSSELLNQILLLSSQGAAYFLTSRTRSSMYLGKANELKLATIFVILINVAVFATVTTPTVASPTADISGSLSARDTYPELTRYKTAIVRARCQARCNAKFGMKKQGTPQEFSQLYRPLVCGQEHSTCQQCSSPCNIATHNIDDCAELCTTNVCRESCRFLNATVYQEAETSDIILSPSSVHPTHSTKITLTSPVPACLYTPVVQEVDSSGPTIVLKWNVLGPTGQSTSHPLSFVIEIKEQKDDGSQTEWEVLGHTNFSVIPIIKLNPSSQYQFRVSAVALDGLVTLPASSEWIHLPPASPPQPPKNVSVVNQYVRGYTLRAEVQWTIPNNVGCYFKLYWMTPKKGSFHSRELKEWVGFRYELNNLDFDSDYKLEIQTYDRSFRIPSKKVTIEFSTPSCLQSTNYNYHSCGPDPPVDVLVNISEPFEFNKSMCTNVTLTWKPPKHVSWHNTVDKYTINWRKTPDLRYMQVIPPDRRLFYVDGDTTELTVPNVHWDSEYVATVAAESKGGQGENAVLKIITGKGYSQLVSGGSHMTDPARASNKVYFVTIIPTVAVAVAVIFCALYYLKQKKNTRFLEHGGPPRKEEMNPLYEMTVPPTSGEGEPLLPNDEYEIDYSSLRFLDLLGEGAFGKVLKAEFTQSDQRRTQGSATRTVAVKMLKEHATPEEKRFLLMEISAMKSLGDHPHLVSIIACVTDIDRPCLVMDYCPLGDLRNYLRQNRTQVQYMPMQSQSTTFQSCTNSTSTVDTSACSSNTNATTNHSSKNTDYLNMNASETLSQITLLSYARQIAVGMEYLNQHRFIHRDLAARNILMSDHRVVKISDFGLSRDVYETNVYQPTSGRRLPYKWMPLESIFDQIFTIKSDVWSYGILLWEIVTLGGCPYPGIPNTDLFHLLREGYRLERPNNCSVDLYSIMLTCWHPRPEDRPSFTQLRKKMESLLEVTCTYIDLSTEVCGDYYTNNSSGHEQGNSNVTEIQIAGLSTN